MSEVLGQLQAYMAAVEARVCACGHDQDAHACTRDKQGCDQCDCDIAIFEIQQNSVRYYDTDEWLTLAEHLQRRRERTAHSTRTAWPEDQARRAATDRRRAPWRPNSATSWRDAGSPDPSSERSTPGSRK